MTNDDDVWDENYQGSESADDCYTNTYSNWYADVDGDGFCDYDNQTEFQLCDDYTGEGLEDDCEQDPQPDCATNDTDECGICGGDNYAVSCFDGSCSGMDCYGDCNGSAEIGRAHV